jgi:hypothetical protein
MKTKNIFVIFLLLVSKLSVAQTTKENISIAFFSEYQKDPLTAYSNVFRNNKWMVDNKSTIETNKIKLKDLLDQLGSYQGYELITEKRAGQSYILKSFLAKYERQPIRYTFILYKAKDNWQIQNLIWDTEVDVELKEAARIDRLRENWE